MNGVPDTVHRNNVQIFKCELPWNSMEAASGSETQMVQRQVPRSWTNFLIFYVKVACQKLPDNQELRLWNFDGILLHNRNVRRCEDELNLGHLGSEPLDCRNLSLLITGTSTTSTVFCTVYTVRTLSVRN